jgi:hypothetical protein
MMPKEIIVEWKIRLEGTRPSELWKNHIHLIAYPVWLPTSREKTIGGCKKLINTSINEVLRNIDVR